MRSAVEALLHTHDLLEARNHKRISLDTATAMNSMMGIHVQNRISSSEDVEPKQENGMYLKPKERSAFITTNISRIESRRRTTSYTVSI